MRRPSGRLAVVFGAGGDRDPGKRAPMGRIAAELADLVVVTDDNPRSEDPAAIRREILAGAAEAGAAAQVVEIGDRREAIDHAVAWAAAGDVVLITGKGHETGQTRGGHTHPVRRPGRARRRARGTAHMIDLTVAQIADIVGGELADISARGGRGCCTSPGPSNSTPARSLPAGCSSRCRGPASTGTTMRRRRWPPERSRYWPPGRSGSPRSWSPPTHTPHRAVTGGLAGVLEHDDDGSGAAVLAALAKLAAAVAAELVAGGLTIVGITGSSGKTSTKDLLAAVLAPLGEVVAPPGSFNNELGHPWTVLRATASTDYLILELSARHPGNIAALAAIAPPAIGVVINVGTAHLGEFGSREAIAKTKSELPQAVPRSGVVVLNVDDPAVAAMAEVTAARVVRVSRHSRTDAGPADVWAGPVTLDELARPQFTLHSADKPSSTSASPSTATIRSAMRCARPRSRWNAAPPPNRWPRRWPAPARCRVTGCG